MLRKVSAKLMIMLYLFGMALVQAQEAALTVEVIQPSWRDLPQRIQAEGEIAAKETAVVSARINGAMLKNLRVRVGDWVEKGEVMARFDEVLLVHELAQASAAQQQAQVRVVSAQTNAARARRLVQDKAMSKIEAERLFSAEQEAIAGLSAAEARLASAQFLLDHAVVRAPFAGIVSAKFAEIGSMIPAGAKLFTLIIGGELEWRVGLSAADLAKVGIGTKVLVRLQDGQTVTGEVYNLSPIAEARTRQVMVYVRLDANPQLRAGLFLAGDFLLDQRRVLTIPQMAVWREDGFSYVWLVDEQNRVQRRKVELGQRFADWVEVQGLNEKQRLVLAGAVFLSDGDTVQVVR